ncbi:MAG: type II secretion system protein [Candidatus Xenobia bacterium]
MLRRRPRGFTLIELLTVIVIMALLAAIFIPHWEIAIERADLSGCTQNLHNIATAEQLYCNDNSGFPSPSLSNLMPNYLKVIPTCPAVSADTYTPGYTANETPPDLSWTISCNGTNHDALGYGANQPFDANGELGP